MNPKETSKLQDFKTMERIESIQKYANNNCNGNFTAAVNKMVDKVLNTKNK